MVSVLNRFGIDECEAIYEVLRAGVGLTAKDVAARLDLDQSAVATYLEQQACLGTISEHGGTYSAWHWL